MREFINIIKEAWQDDEEDEWNDLDDESEDEEEDDGEEVRTTGYSFGRMRSFYQQVVDAANSHMDSGDEIEYSDVVDWVQNHAKLFHPGRITVYRTMRLNPSYVAKLQPGAELGSHWTYEFAEDNLGDFDINGEGEHSTKGEAELFVFEAEIETGDVYFPLTVAYNCLFPHEMEIFLAGNATPILKSITEYDLTSGHGERVRPDLVGKPFNT